MPRRWVREYTPNAAPGYIKVLAATANKNSLSTLIQRGTVVVAALYSKSYGLLETSTIVADNCEAYAAQPLDAIRVPRLN